jgi:hypothetical protein
MVLATFNNDWLQLRNFVQKVDPFVTVIFQFSFFFHVKILRVLKSHTIQVLLTFQICEIFWNAKSLQKGIKLEQSITIYQREMLSKNLNCGFSSLFIAASSLLVD